MPQSYQQMTGLSQSCLPAALSLCDKRFFWCCSAFVGHLVVLPSIFSCIISRQSNIRYWRDMSVCTSDSSRFGELCHQLCALKWHILFARVGKLVNRIPARLLQGSGTKDLTSSGTRKRKVRRPPPQPPVELISFMNFFINECLYLHSLQYILFLPVSCPTAVSCYWVWTMYFVFNKFFILLAIVSICSFC